MARGQIVIATNTNSKRYWNIVAIQNFDSLERYRKSLQAFNALLEEVTMEPSQARTVFGLMAERMAEHRFFESRLEYDELEGEIIPAEKMINEWNNALKSMLSIAPYDEPFDFQIDFPVKISDQLPFREPLATYAVIYFLSSLVRYYPDFLESLLASRDAWIIERFMQSAPVTLLLYMRNLIHGINFAYTLR